MDVVQLNFAYNTKKLQFKQSKFLGSYHSTSGKSIFFAPSRKKLVGAVPAESVPGTETKFVYAKNHHFPREEK